MTSRGWTGLLRRTRRLALWEGLLWVASIVLVLVVGSVLSWVFWDYLHDEQESLSSTVRNLGLVIGAVVAALLAVWRSRVAERQANAAHRQVEAAQKGLLNERYQQGAEMLGSKELSVRLGGIYALQRLAKERPDQYHIQIMRLLCAFVRHPTKHEEIEIIRNLRQDIQAALYAISDCHKSQLHIESDEDYRLGLENSDMSYGVLANLDLSKAQFLGANLSHAFLIRANLPGADLSQTNLQSTNLTYATLMDASIWSSDLTDADLRRANLCRANLVGLDLSQCKLGGVILSHALIKNVNMKSADLTASNLSYISTESSSFAETNLRRCNLSFAGLQGASMRGARLDRSDLQSAELFGADLTDASLRWANVSNANLDDADLANADLTGAQFSRKGENATRGLSQAQLDQARADPVNPPRLGDVADAATGCQLIWRGKPLDDER